MQENNTPSSPLGDIAERLRKAAEEVRSLEPQVKVAMQELDPQHVLNFLRFFGARNA